jgi:exodeoxyribonuclease III
MKTSRREFLRTSALVLSGTALMLKSGCNSAKARKRFKIITYNVWNGYVDGTHSRFPCYPSGQKRKEGIYNWLKEQNADVVFFQELINYSTHKLKEESSFWGHDYAIVHRNKGMTMGFTSRFPIEVKEILSEGMHHGLIHCNIFGIDIIGTHLWPGFDETILDEINVVKQRVIESFSKEIPVIVLGDFNAFSQEDDRYITEELIDLYSNRWKWKLENGRPSYRVIQVLLDLGLKDLYAYCRNKDYEGGRVVEEIGRVDFIFACPSLAEKCLKANHFSDNKFLKLSDHFPVSAEFELG